MNHCFIHTFSIIKIYCFDSLKNSGSVKPDMYTQTHQDNSLTLYFKSMKEQDAGRYTCVANYASTEYLSKSVTIETIVPIKWIDAPENQYPILGKEFKIKCQVSAKPSPAVDWYLNDKLITTDDHYVIETYALKINKVTESDEGVYECRAFVTSTGDIEIRTIRVEVLEVPQIVELPTEVEIIEGKTETITCKASGKPPPKYSWVKSIERKDLSTSDRFGVDKDTGVLTITNVNRDDEGEYQCLASNMAGEAQTITKVVVIGKPKIMEFLNKTAVVGKNVEMTCQAFGRPAPDVTFRKHTSTKAYVVGSQADDDRIVLTSKPDKSQAKTVAVLSIQNVLRSDDGLYECIATNKVAAAYKNGHLEVQFPPSFESMNNRTVWSWDQRPVKLDCIAQSIPNATIRWYFKGNDLSKDTFMYKQIGNGPNSTLEFTPLDGRYYGLYKCHAENIHGKSEHSIELKEGVKPRNLPQARVKEITATTISFDLVLPPSQEGLPIKGITVQYRQRDQDWSQAKNRTWSVGKL